MLQIDHIYEFFYSTFKNVDVHFFNRGIIEDSNYYVFNGTRNAPKILFYDQEPLVPQLAKFYFKAFKTITAILVDPKIALPALRSGQELPYGGQIGIVVTSEYSDLVNSLCEEYDFNQLYYFYHGFAALDWYRGFHALNYNKTVVRSYKYDFISMNRLVSNDRSYRCYFVSCLAEKGLLARGQVSFGLPTEQAGWQEEILDANTKLSAKAIAHIQAHLPNQPLIIDNEHIQGSASADIPRCTLDSFWHIVTETVFYYDKLHLTEKIFKPIVSKQPFMLLAAPGNLEYLRSYGFKTFDGIIDESYDSIQDPDLRTEAVVAQLSWYCGLSDEEKLDIIRAAEPIIEHNFRHFYGEFKQIIVKELLGNTKTLFQATGYDDQHIDYNSIQHILTH